MPIHVESKRNAAGIQVNPPSRSIKQKTKTGTYPTLTGMYKNDDQQTPQHRINPCLPMPGVDDQLMGRVALATPPTRVMNGKGYNGREGGGGMWAVRKHHNFKQTSASTQTLRRAIHANFIFSTCPRTTDAIHIFRRLSSAAAVTYVGTTNRQYRQPRKKSQAAGRPLTGDRSQPLLRRRPVYYRRQHQPIVLALRHQRATAVPRGRSQWASRHRSPLSQPPPPPPPPPPA